MGKVLKVETQNEDEAPATTMLERLPEQATDVLPALDLQELERLEGLSLEPIDTDETYQRAGELLLSIKKISTTFASRIALRKAPALLACQHWDKLKRTGMVAIEAVEQRFVKGRAKYSAEIRAAEELAAKEALKASLLAAQQAREAEIAELKKLAKEVPDKATKAAIVQEVKVLAKAPILAPPPVEIETKALPQTAGLSERLVPKATVSNFAAFYMAVVQGIIPVEALMPNQDYLNSRVKDIAPIMKSWPGVAVTYVPAMIRRV